MTRTGLAIAVSLSVTACTATVGGDGRSVRQHNDDLRRANLELEREVEATRERLTGLEQALAAHRRAADGRTPEDPRLDGAVTPVLAGLNFARYTGPVDTDGDGSDDAVRLYVRPVDQFGRMLVVGGIVNVQVLRVESEQPPRVVAERTFSPGELDGAYRTGLTGDHYTLEVALPGAGLGEAEAVTVLATLTEAGTGQRVERQERFGLQRSGGS
jgi:hypothetical protein